MKKFGIVIHGGASNATAFIKNNMKGIEAGLSDAIQIGHAILKKGGSALKAVEEAVKYLEDNELFNAGRGSAFNCEGEIEMDASIMDGKKLKAGSVAIVRGVKNPISLAKTIMKKTNHVFLSGAGALKFAENMKIILEPESYFATDHQYQEFLIFNEKNTMQQVLRKKLYGTVGAVALDQKGNLAAATSTGGTSNCLPGRIGDSCIIGAGCYANNETCAVSGTGVGEVLINNVVAHSVSMLVELKKLSLQEACDYVILERKTPVNGDIGVISIDQNAKLGISFNCEIMKRAWWTSEEDLQIKVFR